MVEHRTLLGDVALVFLVASVATILFQRLRQPTVLGYLLAGLVVGPHFPVPLFADLSRIEELSKLGIILVIFTIGLDFRFARLQAVLPTSGLAALVQVPGMLFLGYAVGQLAGWKDLDSLFLGGAMCISSTMIVARVLTGPDQDPRVSENAFGILIVQDIAAIVLIAVFTALASGVGIPAAAVAQLVGELALFVVIATVGGLIIVPRLIRESNHRNSDEVLLVTAIGICFGMALVAEQMKFSVALGAFIAGTVIAESGVGKRVEHLVIPVRDVFAGLFFVSIGMLVDPKALADNWAIILIVSATVVVGQVVLITVGSALAGRSVGVAVSTALSMTQIGEFSFIIVGVGVTAGAIHPRLMAIAVGVAVLTTFLTPLLVRRSGSVADAVERRLPHSLQTFLALYASWLDSLHNRPHTAGRLHVRRYVFLLIFDSAAIGTLIVTVGLFRDRLAVLITEKTGLSLQSALVIVVAVAIILAVPFVHSFALNLRRLGARLAAHVLPPSDAGVDLADAPRRALVIGLELAISLLAIAPLMALSAPFVPLYVIIIVVINVLLGLGILFQRRTTNLFGHVRASAEVMLEFLHNQRQSDDSSGQSPQAPGLHTILPGLGPLESVEIFTGNPCVDRSLAELNLRARSGATVLALRRADGTGLGMPAGDDRVAAGDVLTLSGTTSAIALARRLLSGEECDSEKPSGVEVFVE